MAIVNERYNPAKPVQVDPKTGKPLAGTPRAASPTVPDADGNSNSGFFGSFFAAKNKKKAAAMEAPPPTLKASGTLSERENIEVEVISTFTSNLFWSIGANARGRAAHLVVLQHRQANHDRHGSQSCHAQPCSVSTIESWTWRLL